MEPKGFIILAKVRLADLVWVPKSYKRFFLYFSRIKAKHIDFVICDPITSEIKLLIELDDKTHDMPANKSRDKFKDKVIQHANLPFIRCSSPEHVCHIVNQ